MLLALSQNKDETFYLQSGKLFLYYSDIDSIEDAKSIILNPGR